MRPDRHEWHQRGAKWLAEMGDCTRSGVGALIVGPDKRIWGMGYNGGRPGGPSCLEGACPRGRHYKASDCNWPSHQGMGYDPALYGCTPKCACGNAWPCPDAVAPGSSYDTGPGACISTHAESNAKTDAMRRGGGDLAGCVMHVSREPCEGCLRDLRNTTRIEAIFWPEGMTALP